MTFSKALVAQFLGVLLGAACPPTDSSGPPGPLLSSEITAAELRAHVAFLADDELLGRDTGSPGGLAAATYLAARLKAYGLAPGGDDGGYLRAVELERTTVEALPELVVTDADGTSSTGGYRTEFDVRFNVPATGALRVFAVDVREASPMKPDAEVAVVLVGTSGRSRRWLEACGSSDGSGWGLVVRKGSRPKRQYEVRLTSSLRRAPTDGPRPGPTASWVRVYDPLFERLASGAVATVELRTHVAVELVRASNVVGVIAGQGTEQRPELAREAIVVSAHYDHIGAHDPHAASAGGSRDGLDGEAGEEEPDRIYNGADDNASGTAAVIELAGALAAGPPPARTVVFLLATGEEKGLLGTQAYLDDPTVSLENTVFNLNIEMIGRPDPLVGGAGRLWLVGWDLTDLGPALEQRGLAIVADPRPEQHFFERSDNIAFVRRGIVGQSLSSYCMHDDYHRPSDEADTLDYAHLATCTREALRALRPIVEGELTPAWVGDAPGRGR